MGLWFLLLLTVVAIGGAGLVIKLYTDRTQRSGEVTWQEYWVAMGIISLAVVPLVGWAGFSLAKRDNLTYHEFMNGWEARAYSERTSCHEDGSCSWTYDSDPYTVQVSYDCGDSKQSRTCYRTETRYHQCPYVTYENSYYIDTTIGTYVIDTARFPTNPNQHRWREYKSVPSYVSAQAGIGEPVFWSTAKERLANGNPWPVTKTHSYSNYVLASHYTILKRYRKAADEYRAMKLLPSITSKVRDGSFYRSDKVSVVGCNTGQYEHWDEGLERLNAALGSELQGDVRLVLVCDVRVNRNPDAYKFALQAYWQDADVFRRTALPKNTIVITIGTADGRTVSWGRAFTGMPVGNNTLVAAIRDRFSAPAAIPWKPEAVIGVVTGNTHYDGKKYQSSSIRSGGVLTDVLWGDSNRATRFVRVSMSGKHNGTGGSGFLYLKTQIEITGFQKFLITFMAFFVSALVFMGVAFTDILNLKGSAL